MRFKLNFFLLMNNEIVINIINVLLSAFLIKLLIKANIISPLIKFNSI